MTDSLWFPQARTTGRRSRTVERPPNAYYLHLADSQDKLDSTNTDRSLLRRLRGGDEAAAARLYEKYARQLHHVARRKTDGALANRIDADDVVQSVFRTFFRRTARGEFEVPEGQELWRLLLTIALNKVRNHADYHRAQKRDLQKTVGADDANHVAEPDQTGRVILQMMIQELLGDLEESQKQIIQMRIDGAEVAEIAHVTGRAKRSVERVLQGFRNELANRLQLD